MEIVYNILSVKCLVRVEGDTYKLIKLNQCYKTFCSDVRSILNIEISFPILGLMTFSLKTLSIATLATVKFCVTITITTLITVTFGVIALTIIKLSILTFTLIIMSFSITLVIIIK